MYNYPLDFYFHSYHHGIYHAVYSDLKTRRRHWPWNGAPSSVVVRTLTFSVFVKPETTTLSLLQCKVLVQISSRDNFITWRDTCSQGWPSRASPGTVSYPYSSIILFPHNANSPQGGRPFLLNQPAYQVITPCGSHAPTNFSFVGTVNVSKPFFHPVLYFCLSAYRW